MRLAAKTEYALKTLVELGLSQPGVTVRVGAIAKKHGIPRNFLEQILLTLRNAGITESRRGVQGGYRLAVNPAMVSLAAILQAAGDPLVHSGDLHGSVTDPSRAVDRVIADVFHCVEAEIQARLDAVSLRDLCEQTRRRTEAAGANYAI